MADQQRQQLENMSEEDIIGYTAVFNTMDKDGGGYISSEELHAFLTKTGSKASYEEALKMIKDADSDSDGQVSLEEFLVIMGKTAKNSGKAGDDELMNAFRMFDKDGDGEITVKELKEAMKCLDENMTDAEIEDMVREVDKDGDGTVSFEEFKQMMS